MEDFFDYILGLFLVVLLGMIGALIYFSIHAPLLAHILASSLVAICIGGISLLVRGTIRKKRLGDYYPLLQSISQSHKEVTNAFRRLERPARTGLKPLLPKIKLLRKTVKEHIWRIYRIDKTLLRLNQQPTPELSVHPPFFKNNPDERKIDYHKHYYENIQKIEASKTQYLREIQEALQYLHSLHAQLLALQYSLHEVNIAGTMAETLDELLIEMEALQEIE